MNKHDHYYGMKREDLVHESKYTGNVFYLILSLLFTRIQEIADNWALNV